jgi:hypothetical protein
VELLDTKVSASKPVSTTFNSLYCRWHMYSKNMLFLRDQILPASNVIFHHRLNLLSMRVNILTLALYWIDKVLYTIVTFHGLNAL